MYDIGSIIGSDGTTLLKMWNVFVQPGKHEMRKHNHIYFELTYVESGNGVYTVGNEEHKIEKGSIFVFASNEYHCITDVGENGLTLLNLHFEPKYLWGNSVDSLSEESINICFSHNKSFKNCISPDDSTELSELLIKIKEEL